MDYKNIYNKIIEKAKQEDDAYEHYFNVDDNDEDKYED